VSWLPFQLNPDIPAGGMPRQDYIAMKFGPGGRGKYEQIAAVGRQVGLELAFDKIKVQPNTVNAHCLMNYAGDRGRQDEMAEALFRGYFTEGADLTDNDTLADLAASAGLEREAVAAYLASGADRERIENADMKLRAGGIQGVPFFIFNRKVGVSGAQDAEVLLQAMRQSLEEG
jgi:predicted DsbA family dithiol-disulfide isomerase